MLGNTWKRVGRLIQERREKQGLSQRILAESAGVGVVTLHAIEAGKSSPRIDTLEALCTVLGITPADIWGPPKESANLSASAIPGPLTPADCAAVLLQLAEVSPERRAFVLGVLFDDASIVPDSLAGDLPRLLSTFR